MTENDIIRELRRDPRLQSQCKGLGEFVFLVGTARTTWLMSGGDEAEMERAFSPHIIDLARLEAADVIVELVRQSSVYPPVAGA
jgi:hypothetical protein